MIERLKQIRLFVAKILTGVRTHRRLFWRILWGIVMLLGLLLFLRGLQARILTHPVVGSEDDSAIVARFHNVVNERIAKGKKLIKQCGEYMRHVTPFAGLEYYEAEILPRLRSEHLEVLLAKNDSIIAWSYRYGSSDWEALKKKDKGYIWLYGLWYYTEMYTLGEYQCAVLAYIRSDYRVQNRYLESAWDSSLSFLYGEHVPTLAKEAPELFTNSEQLERYWSDNRIFFGFLILFAIFFFLPAFFSKRYRWLWSLLGTTLALSLLALCKFNGWLINEMGNFFNPELFAVSTLVASFGDLFLYAIGCLGLLLQLRFLTPLPEPRTAFTAQHPIWSAVWLLITLALLQVVNTLAHVLVTNSTIALTPYSFANMSVYALMVFISLAILCALLTMSSIIAIRLLQPFSLKVKCCAWGIVFFLNFLFQYLFFGIHSFWCVGLFVPQIFVGMYWIRRATERPLFTGFYTILAILYAVPLCYILDHTDKEKDLNVRAYIASSLGNEHDLILEYLFVRLSHDMQHDAELRDLVNDAEFDVGALNKHFRHHHYRAYLLEYDFQLTLCFPETEIIITSSGQRNNCQDFFSHMIHDYGTQIVGTNFYYLDNKNGRISYLGIFNYGSAYGKLSTLYLELDSKLPHYYWGYPDLLIDRKYARPTPRSTFSTALFQNQKLLAQSGDYHYPVRVLPDYFTPSDLKTFDYNGYSHFVKVIDENTFAVVSKPLLNILARAGGVAYLILVFMLVFNFILYPSHILPVFPFFTHGLAGRIQRIILYTILFYIPLSIIGIQYILRSSLRSDDVAHLREHIAVVQNELEAWLPRHRTQLQDTGYINWTLAAMSNRLYCDINLYSTEGWLLGSSRSAIYQQQLLGTRIHDIAWNRLKHQSASQYIQSECVGDMHYTSIYAPLFCGDEVLGYANVPYFRNPQSEQTEYIHLASLILNILLLFTAVKILVMSQFTNRITRYLHRIRYALERISITNPGIPIDYKSKDEIGMLIATYNRMVSDIQEKAARLRESERESAWKEMARQIAHDIKNPLTPMKLGVQHLVHLKKSGAKDWDERFLKYAQMLEAQIDSLAETADTFTRYATLTLGNAERTPLCKAIEQSLWLFRSHENIDWVVDLSAVENVEVFIDPTNLQRVFNNLFSNAVQAMQQTAKPRIAVKGILQGTVVRVFVEDNGVGIAPALHDKIFKVNFTTKSTGLGLGLAITANILKSAGGDISFKTEEGRGTAFMVSLPIIQ